MIEWNNPVDDAYSPILRLPHSDVDITPLLAYFISEQRGKIEPVPETIMAEAKGQKEQ